MGRASAPISKEDMKKELNEVAGEPDNAASIQAEIKAAITSLPVAQKNALKKKLTDAGLPTAYNKVTDPNILNQILTIVSA